MEKEKISIKYIKAKGKLIKSKLSGYKQSIKSKLSGYEQSIKEFAEYYRSHFTLITATILLFLSFFAFSSFWVDLINKYWVNPITSKLIGNKATVAILISIVLSTIAYYYTIFKFEKIFSKKRVIIALLFLTTYLLCFFSGEWDFYSFYNCKCLSYSNVLLLPVIAEITFSIIRITKKKREKLSHLLVYEKPISKREEDSYERSPYLNSTAEVLKTCFYEEGSFAVGITGSWGSGKTSSVLAIKDSICKDADIVIDFYPWKSTTPNSIIKDFFSLYKSKINLYAPKLSFLIPKYVIALLDAKGSTLSNTLEATLNSIFSCSDDDDISFQYEEISNILKKTQIKTLVIIDDLDRLECCEIMEVLRLIRNSANFPFIQFVTAYDKEYLIESLKGCNIPKGEQYLEKIFNLEITLPKFEERIICEELCVCLAPQAFSEFNIDENELRDILFLSENKEQEDFYYVIPKMLCTKRDVIRFSNSFKIVLKAFVDKGIIAQIKYKDLLIIELLRYKFLDIYELLRTNPLRLLSIDCGVNLSLKVDYKDFIKGHTEEENKLIHSFMSTLFENEEGRSEVDPRRIAHIRGLGKYFSYRLNKKDILLSEMYDLILNTNSQDTLQIAEEWSETKHNGEIERNLRECFSSLDEKTLTYKKIYAFTRILLSSKKEKLQREAMQAASYHIKAFEYKTNDQFIDLLKLWDATLLCNNQCLYINNDDIIIMILSRESLIAKFKRNIESEDIKMIKEFILKTSAPLQMSNLLKTFAEDKDSSSYKGNKLILRPENIRSILLTYLQIHIMNDCLDSKCFSLFYNCMRIVDKYSNQRALKLMTSFVKSHAQEYIIRFIRTGESTSELLNTILPEFYYKELFGSEQEFKDFIKNKKFDKFKDITKVRNYWDLYSNNDYKEIRISNERISNTTVEEIISNDFREEKKQLKELLKMKYILKNMNTTEITFGKFKTLNKLKGLLEYIQLPIKLRTDVENTINQKWNELGFDKSNNDKIKRIITKLKDGNS